MWFLFVLWIIFTIGLLLLLSTDARDLLPWVYVIIVINFAGWIWWFVSQESVLGAVMMTLVHVFSFLTGFTEKE